jgi:GT2 family glycosyltransferase
LVESVARILECDPPPAELLIHVDDCDRESIAAANAIPRVRVIVSPDRVGPGGGRNRLLAAASFPIVASFDDDSYPIDANYFLRLLEVFNRFPRAAVVAAAVSHRGETVADADPQCHWTANFVGCGCAYRRDVFLKTDGYVPLPLAYGMEEVDLSLQLFELGWRVLEAPILRVRHNTSREHHLNADVTSAMIANTCLLTYLRYPIGQWPLGMVRCLRLVAWLLCHRRFQGIARGLWGWPLLLKTWRHRRQTVSIHTLQRWRELSRKSEFAGKVNVGGLSPELSGQCGP